MLTAANNARLSRRVLWGLIFLYLIPGLLGRAPWKPDDALGFGLSWFMAAQPLSDWSIALIGDRLLPEEGLLSAWVSALIGKAALLVGVPLNWVDDFMRLGNVIWLVLAGWAIWNATYRLALRSELQPEDPFGTAPRSVDYARAVADSSVLCLLGTLGLLIRSHYQVAELAEMAGLALVLLAAVRSLDRPLGAGWMLGLGLVIAFFSRGWAHGLPFALILLFSSLTHPSLRFCVGKRVLRALAVFGLSLIVWGFWLSQHPQGSEWLVQWMRWNADNYLWLFGSDRSALDLTGVTLKTLAWFLWPILPMGVWAIVRYRKAWSAPAIRLPISGFLAGLFVMLATDPSDEANFFPMIPPLCVLAAIGLSTMKRGFVSLVDWFAVFCMSFIALLVWLGWSAATFGWPSKIAANFEKLSPGYVPEINLLELIIALAATTAWVLLIRWRTGRSASKSNAIWRPMVLTSGGVTLIWLLMMTLWIQRIDYAKSFDSVGRSLKEFVLTDAATAEHSSAPGSPVSTKPAAPCILDHNLGFPIRALIEYHSGLPFKKSLPSTSECQYVLIEDSLRTDLALTKEFVSQSNVSQLTQAWQQIWIGFRNSDRHERLVLMKRLEKNQLEPASQAAQ